MKYNEIKGDIITLGQEGKFDVIAHGCNCFCRMGSGLAPQMVKAFNCNKFPLERLIHKGDINKLGQIDWQPVKVNDGQTLIVVNAYSQYTYGSFQGGSKTPIDYEALTLCLRKMNHRFHGKHIGLPLIGAGLAGGDWERIKGIIQTEFTKCDVTIVHYKK
tara:strand:+ start:161677 stop:162156 length:480 start_codon:yes stop_codon:yes gene_type:complete